MKNTFLILIISLIISFNSNAQTVKKIKVILVKKDSIVSKIIANKKLSDKDSEFYTILQDDKNYVKLRQNIFHHSAVANHHITIQLLNTANNEMTLAEANLSSIKINDILFSDYDRTKKYVLIKLKEELGNKPKNGKLISIKIETDDGIRVIRWFRYINGWQPYNFLDNGLGIWFPTNMYSTSFERSENGVKFTTMPIGFAIGGKYNISQNFYLGFSAALSYTLAKGEEYISESSDEKKSFLLNDISIGPLVDFGGYFYLGYMKPINFTNQSTALKPQFVIGIGIEIPRILMGTADKK